MNKTNIRYGAYVQILKEELVPAMGCTEPVAIAYGAAKAREILGCLPERVLIEASGNIIKNVKSVIVPNTNHLKGIPAAAAAGIIAGKAERELEVIAEVSSEEKTRIQEYLDTHEIQVMLMESKFPFDLIFTLAAGKSSVKLRIVQYHTNIVFIEKDGEVLYQVAVEGEGSESLTDRQLLNVADILDFADTVAIDDIAAVLDKQIECNTAIAQAGLSQDYGANIGSVLLAAYGNDVKVRAKAKAAAGSDARMAGCELPVVINSGSGNQGLTASLPVIEYAGELKVSQDKLYRALVLSNLITIHQKTRLGRLSAYCGAVNAGAGAGAGIAYLYGGGYEEISHTLVNALAIVSGIVCDGAKASCAAKIAFAVDAGILGYHMYQAGQEFKSSDGIVKKGVEENIEMIGRLGREGMRETDKEILKIMLEK